MTDQHHAGALSCAGHPAVRTPNIDRIAASGVRFSKAFCPSPVCGPSRASLFSGLYSSATGATENPGVFKREVDLLPALFRDSSYHTALVGKLHLGPHGVDFGFTENHIHDAGYDTYHPEEPRDSEYVAWLAERKFGGDRNEVIRRFNEDEECFEADKFRFIMGSNWRTEEEHCNTWVTNRTLDVIRSQVSGESAPPFFLFCSYFGPHQPMLAPEPWGSLYNPDEIELPAEFAVGLDDKPIASAKLDGSPFRKNPLSEKQYRQALAAYYGQISMIDHGIGEILDELDRSGLTENTVIVFTSDHGDHCAQFGLFFKCTMYQGAVAVPLIVADPLMKKSAGSECRQVVNSMDLYATLLERAGIAVPKKTHSRSLSGLLRNPQDPGWPNRTFSELGNLKMVADGHWKLIRSRNPAGSPSYELYDLDSPVADSENLWERTIPSQDEKNWLLSLLG
jgi:arylsulfatase A-like enzyme